MSRMRFFNSNTTARSTAEVDIICLQALITQHQNALAWKKFELQNMRAHGIFHKNKGNQAHQDFLVLQVEIEKQEKIKLELEMKLCEMRNEKPSKHLIERAEYHAQGERRLHPGLYSAS